MSDDYRLPEQPRETTHRYLAAVLDELRGLRADLASAREPQPTPEATESDVVALSEPQVPPTTPKPRSRKTVAI